VPARSENGSLSLSLVIRTLLEPYLYNKISDFPLVSKRS
jgi:hypothetical protein